MQDTFDSDAIDEIDRETASKPATATAPATAKAAAAPTAPPGTKLVDPFAHYAASEGDSFFNGDYVQLDQKLGWVRGEAKKPLDGTEAWVADMQDARHGYIKFSADGPATRKTARILESPEPPPREACGDNDKLDWPMRGGERRDPWQPVVYLPMRSVADPDDVVCFTGTGKGARKAMAQLCRIYARPGADRQGKDPVILLEGRSFQNDSGGTTTWPIFKMIGLDYFTPGTPAPPVQSIAIPIAPPAKPTVGALPKRGELGDMDDDIPF